MFSSNTINLNEKLNSLIAINEFLLSFQKFLLLWTMLKIKWKYLQLSFHSKLLSLRSEIILIKYSFYLPLKVVMINNEITVTYHHWMIIIFKGLFYVSILIELSWSQKMGIKGIINPNGNCFQFYVEDNHQIINYDPNLNHVTSEPWDLGFLLYLHFFFVLPHLTFSLHMWPCFKNWRML